jgi:Cohesin domain
VENAFTQKITKVFLGVGLALLLCVSHAATALAATLFFSPSSGSYTVGETLTTSVYVNTQAEAVNNADAVITFPKNLVEVVSVSTAGSIFSLWVEQPAFSNSAGTISFNGGLPTPGFNGSGGKIIGITFRLKESGSASLSCSAAAVRANDGLGTDVLQACGQALFTLNPAEAPAPEEEVPIAPPEADTSVPYAPTVSSSTHPVFQREPGIFLGASFHYHRSERVS